MLFSMLEIKLLSFFSLQWLVLGNLEGECLSQRIRLLLMLLMLLECYQEIPSRVYESDFFIAPLPVLTVNRTQNLE